MTKIDKNFAYKAYNFAKFFWVRVEKSNKNGGPYIYLPKTSFWEILKDLFFSFIFSVQEYIPAGKEVRLMTAVEGFSVGPRRLRS